MDGHARGGMPVLFQLADEDVDRFGVCRGAEERRRLIYERVVAAEAELKEQMGVENATKLLMEAKGNLGLTDGIDYLSHSRRIFVVARRR